MMPAIIDAHHHLWNPARGDYGWMDGLPDEAAVTLKRPYRLADLEPLCAAHGIGKTILVQAAPTVAETEYMLGVADSSENIGGVIGWVDFEDRTQGETLRRLAAHPKFLGVRPMIQDLPDPDWMLRGDVQWAFEAIIDHELVFEALGFPVHLANFHTILTRYPSMRAVLDHCIKPEIRNHPRDPSALSKWADGMTALARDTSAMCKFSALVTEAKPDWTDADLKPFTDHVIDVFGPDRLIWGSDWPVCLLASSYERWLTSARNLTSQLTEAERHAIFFGNANTFYRLGL